MSDTELDKSLLHAMIMCSLRHKMDDITHPLMNKEQRLEHDKLRFLEYLYERFAIENIEFSWEEAHKRRWLSEWAYDVFDELSDLKIELNSDPNYQKILELRKTILQNVKL